METIREQARPRDGEEVGWVWKIRLLIESAGRSTTDDERRYKYSMLVQRNGGGIMKRGVGRAVSDKMRVPVRVVQRIWMAGRRGGGIHAVASKKPKNCGRKRVEPDPDALRVLPLDGRMTIRELAEALGMKKSTLFQRLKEDGLGHVILEMIL
ncbi:SEC14-like protein 5 [Hordeum vulgare]|nr:SEC14-like protein 5 [Hordeum vulgare]